MDLTRLYNLTTPELRTEAERLGVPDTYAMSRGQLIQAIRAKSGTAQPDGFLGKVFGFAKWALQAAGETATGRPAPVDDPPLPTMTGATADADADADADTDTGTDTGTGTDTDTDTGTDTRTGTDTVTVTVAATAADTAAAAAPASPTASGPPSRPPAGVFTSGAGLFEEPFPTLTMARILAEQGHYKRALAIYTQLVHDSPDDGELAAEAESVRAASRSRRSHAPH